MSAIKKLFFFFIFNFFISHLFAGEPTIPLTDEQISWLKEHPVIRVAPDPDFPPIEFADENRQLTGIMADYLPLLEKKIGVSFEVVMLKNWDEVIAKGKTRDVDMFSAATPTPDRLEYMKFTKAVLEFPAVIIVKEDTEIPESINKLEGLRVAVVSNYSSHEYVSRYYKGVTLEVVPDIISGLRLVSFGRVDAMILNIASASYYIEKEGITNLKIYKDTDFLYDLSIATRNDWPLLNSILDKAIASITPAEKTQIIDRWVSLKHAGWRVSKQWIMMFSIIVILVFVIVILMMNSRLKKLVESRTQELQNELKERIKAEREKEELQHTVIRAKKMEALGLLAGGVAHDLNNILSGILSYPDLLLTDLPEGHKMRRPLEIIRETGYRAKAVVSDLLTVARGVASEKSIINLNLLIKEYVTSPEFRELNARHSNISVNECLSEEIMNIQASEIHINKVIHNLILNGMEAFHKNDSGIITVKTREEFLKEPLKGYSNIVEGIYCVMEISDNGPGISEGDIERIFEPFYSKKIMGRSGTGLGLTVVWNAMLDHNGYVTVSSSKEGTRFVMYFPASDRDHDIQEAPTSNINDLKGNGEPILIVDDEEIQRNILSDILIKLNYTPESVSSGEEAVEYLKHNSAKLVVLDMIMDPGINGRETYEEILKLNKNQKAIIASGFSQTEDVSETLKMGAGAFINKPYDMASIGTVIKGELSK